MGHQKGRTLRVKVWEVKDREGLEVGEVKDKEAKLGVVKDKVVEVKDKEVKVEDKEVKAKDKVVKAEDKEVKVGVVKDKEVVEVRGMDLEVKNGEVTDGVIKDTEMTDWVVEKDGEMKVMEVPGMGFRNGEVRIGGTKDSRAKAIDIPLEETRTSMQTADITINNA
jgi:hypothetical protein